MPGPNQTAPSLFKKPLVIHMKKTLLIGSLVLALAGCGGGGGGGPAPLQLDELQGFWSGPLSGTSLQAAATTQAVVLPNGTAWFLLLPASGAPTGMVKATLSVSGATYTGSGKVYEFATGGVTSLNMTGSAQESSSLSSAITVSGAAGATNATMTYSSAYATPVTLANVAGSWQVSASSGALQVNWTVQGNGSLTGTSTTGCTWSGAFTTRAGGTAVLDYTATETCASVSTVYTGIAVLNGARTTGTLFVTTPADAQGLVLSMSKMSS
jgi:hypothetical protein